MKKIEAVIKPFKFDEVKELGSSTRGEVNNLFKMTHDRRATV